MLHFIDISNWQRDINLDNVMPNIDAIICKATEGVNFVDNTCDKFVQKCIAAGKSWGFYHFARNNDAEKEAEFFYNNCKNYFGHGIPVLDWEADQNVVWVNKFVRKLHDLSGIWCWIYANPWRFNQGGVEQNCMRWVAAYPSTQPHTFTAAETWVKPSADGLVGAWQFCSDGKINGYYGNLDCNLFYGSKEAWSKYAGVDTSTNNNVDNSSNTDNDSIDVFETDKYKITIEEK